MSDAVIVAIIGVIGTVCAGIPAVLIERARRENNNDHALVQMRLSKIMNALKDLSDKVGKVDGRLEGHLKEHLDGIPSNVTNRRATRSDKISRKQ
jgi:hypothetical protein